MACGCDVQHTTLSETLQCRNPVHLVRKTSKEKAPKSVWLVTSVKSQHPKKQKNTERERREAQSACEEEEHPEDISSALRRVFVLRRNALHDWDRQNQE